MENADFIGLLFNEFCVEGGCMLPKLILAVVLVAGPFAIAALFVDWYRKRVTNRRKLRQRLFKVCGEGTACRR